MIGFIKTQFFVTLCASLLVGTSAIAEPSTVDVEISRIREEAYPGGVVGRAYDSDGRLRLEFESGAKNSSYTYTSSRGVTFEVKKLDRAQMQNLLKQLRDGTATCPVNIQIEQGKLISFESLCGVEAGATTPARAPEMTKPQKLEWASKECKKLADKMNSSYDVLWDEINPRLTDAAADGDRAKEKAYQELAARIIGLRKLYIADLKDLGCERPKKNPAAAQEATDGERIAAPAQ